MGLYPAPQPRPLFDDEKNLMASLAHEGETWCEVREEWVEDDSRTHTCCQDDEDDDPSDVFEPDTVAEWRGDK